MLPQCLMGGGTLASTEMLVHLSGLRSSPSKLKGDVNLLALSSLFQSLPKACGDHSVAPFLTWAWKRSSERRHAVVPSTISIFLLLLPTQGIFIWTVGGCTLDHKPFFHIY